MTFRTRLSVVAAAAVAVAVVVASGIIYFVVRGQLRGQIDEALGARAAEVVNAVTPRFVQRGGITMRVPPTPLGATGGYVQIFGPEGEAFPLRVGPTGQAALARDEPPAFEPDDRALRVALGEGNSFFSDVTVGGNHLRVLTAPLQEPFGIQVARSMEEVDDSLQRLTLILLLVSGIGIGVATAVGWLVARSAVAPVRRLTEAAEHVTSTSDLSRRIESTGTDELARLAQSFNAMLAALEASMEAQRQLVADASHELRTPLTSLRTNIEVLARGQGLSEDERRSLLNDVVGQLEDLSILVGDLVELARDHVPDAEMEVVRLDAIVENAVERTRRNTPETVFMTQLDPSIVQGAPARLDRAVSNLLNNAAKFSPPGGLVEVVVRPGQVVVRDRGPGIEEADLPLIFDRFYRSSSARGMPGSGLGLAIVKQVAESHGGRVLAENVDEGGARFTLSIPEFEPGDHPSSISTLSTTTSVTGRSA